MTKDKMQINWLKLIGASFFFYHPSSRNKRNERSKTLLRDENWVSILIQILTD